MQQLKWIIQTVNSNKEVKLESQLRALELLLYISLDKSCDAQLSSWLKENNRQVWMMQEINSKCNERKSTSATDWQKDRVQESAMNVKAQVQLIDKKTEFKEVFIWFVLSSEFLQFNRVSNSYASRFSGRDAIEAFRYLFKD